MASGDNLEQNLEWSLKNGDLEQVKLIVEKNKSVANSPLPSGRQPLCVAADYGQTEVISYLLSKGANVNAADKHGITPLLSAIYEGHTQSVKLLLEKGATKTGKAPDGSKYIDCATDDEIKKMLK